MLTVRGSGYKIGDAGPDAALPGVVRCRARRVSGRGRMRSVLDRLPLGRLPLRHRIGVAFAGVSMVVTGLFAAVTWNLASYYLVEQRVESATRQLAVNLQLVERAMVDDTHVGGLDDLLTGLAGTPGTTVALRRDGTWTTSGREVDPGALPAGLLAMAGNGTGARQRVMVAGCRASSSRRRCPAATCSSRSSRCSGSTPT